ncbi:MAG: hypothetical protein J2P17_18825 [Mycobacterium sp.]|nr:hypothetical protein [Mycobacterium sp.]
MGFDVPKAIKRVTKSDLVALSDEARELHLGIGRRSDWLTEHLADSSAGVLWAIVRESHPQLSYRCQIVSRHRGDGIENFLLDLVPEDFQRLPDLTEERFVRLARWALSHVPVSPCQPSTWQRANRDDIAAILYRLILDAGDTTVTETACTALLERGDTYGLRLIARAIANTK